MIGSSDDLQIFGELKIGNVTAVDEFVLSKPQAHRLLHQIGHVQVPVPPTIDTAEILTQIPEAVAVVAVVVLQVTGFQVQRGQVLQLLIPHHGGHAGGRIVAGQRSRGNVVPALVVLIHDKLAIRFQVYHSGIRGAAFMEFLLNENLFKSVKR